MLRIRVKNRSTSNFTKDSSRCCNTSRLAARIIYKKSCRSSITGYGEKEKRYQKGEKDPKKACEESCSQEKPQKSQSASWRKKTARSGSETACKEKGEKIHKKSAYQETKSWQEKACQAGKKESSQQERAVS